MIPIRTLAIGLLFTYGCLFAPAAAQAQFAATPFSDPATGETYHVEAAIALWNPAPNLKVASSQFGQAGTTIDAVNDLGIDRKRLTELRFVLRPARKHKFRINYLPISYSAVSTIHRDFTFNNIRYGVNLPVTSEIAWTTWLLGYEYDFLYRDRWFVGFVMQVKATDVKVDLKAPIGSDFVHARAPIPNVGGIARVYVAPNISITGELVGFKIPESVSDNFRAHYFDFDLYGTVNFNDYVGAQIGYRSLDLGYLVDKDQGDFKMKGIYFGGVVRY